MVDVNSENSCALFKHGKDENQIFSNIDKAGGDENNGLNDNTQSIDYNNSDDFDKRTGIHDIKDCDDDSCSTTSEILISVTDLRHCTLFETTDAKELSRINDPSPNSGNKEEAINAKSMELLDNCTGSTQGENYSDCQMTLANQETGNISVVKTGKGLFAISSNAEIAGEPLAMPIDCETDVGPTAVVSGAEKLKGPVATANDDGALTAVLNDTISVIGPVAMADDAEMSAEPITVSDDEESVEIIMANGNGTVERPIALANDDAVVGDGEYTQGLFPMATVAERPVKIIAGSGDDDDDDELASKLSDAECDAELSIQPVAANGAELAEIDSQHVSELSCSLLQKTAEDNKMGTGHCGLQNEKVASRFVEMEMEISTELEASSLEDLETQQTESSMNVSFLVVQVACIEVSVFERP